MELKLQIGQQVVAAKKVLIVLYGIETDNSLRLRRSTPVLIVLYGIETRQSRKGAAHPPKS